jgi:energy-converting hydrogenase Eha subunit C
MGESLRTGNLWGLANLTYSPGYPILLGIAQIILQTDPLNEIPYLKMVNVGCLVLAMGACDIIMMRVKKELAASLGAHERPLPFWAIMFSGYGAFLVGALVWVRPGLLSPDILMDFLVLAVALIILWIKEDPDPYRKYVVLGIALAIGYVSKAWFLVFSPFWILLAAMAAAPIRRAIPRLGVALAVMAVVCAPLVASLSYRMGRLSHGELSRYAYVHFIAGQGECVNKPELLNEHPKTVLYRYSIPCTHPPGFDICYWRVGLQPKFDLKTHAAVIYSNTVGFLSDTPLLAIILAWLLYQCAIGSFSVGRLYPPSTATFFLACSVISACFFLSICIDKRYWAPFFFFGCLGLLAGFRYSLDEPKSRRRAVTSAVLLGLVFHGMAAQSLMDQAISGLFSSAGKPSYAERYQEQIAIRDALRGHGVMAGDEVAVVDEDLHVYWARMAGVRVVGHVVSKGEFMAAGPEERARSIHAMQKSGLRAVVARGSNFAALSSEGWEAVPGRGHYAVLPLRPKLLSDERLAADPV